MKNVTEYSPEYSPQSAARSRAMLDGSPTRVRTWDLRINSTILGVSTQRQGPPSPAKARQTMPFLSHTRTLSRSICATVSYTMEALMTTLTIRLDPKLEKALERVAKSSGRTKSEIAREALRRQVAVARFRELRRKTLPFAEAQGLVTDEDVFRLLA